MKQEIGSTAYLCSFICWQVSQSIQEMAFPKSHMIYSKKQANREQ